jgi:hypothetical protein
VTAFEDPDRLGLRIWDVAKLCGLPERDVQLALPAREAAGLLGETARGVATEVVAKVIVHAGGMG